LLLTLLALPGWAQDKAPEPLAPVSEGKLTLTIDPGRHTSPIVRAFFNPRDSNQLITLAGDGAIRLWDVAAGQTTHILYPPGVPYTHAALSPDGKRLAVPCRYPEKGKDEHAIYVMSLPEGRLEKVLRSPHGYVNLAFSPDGKRLAFSRSIWRGVPE